MNKKTIFLFVNQQFHIRYFLQTNIYKNLAQNSRVIVLSPNSKNDIFLKKYRLDNVVFESLKYKEIKLYLSRRVMRFFSATRRYIYYSDLEAGTILLKEKFEKQKYANTGFINRVVKLRYIFFAKII